MEGLRTRSGWLQRLPLGWCLRNQEPLQEGQWHQAVHLQGSHVQLWIQCGVFGHCHERDRRRLPGVWKDVIVSFARILFPIPAGIGNLACYN